MSGDPLEAQIGIVREGGGKGPNIPDGTKAGDKRGLKKGYRGLIGSRLGKRTDLNLQVIKWLVH